MNKNQEKAMIALINAPTITQAAKDSGIGEATFYRYLKDAEFSEAYNDARRQIVESAISGLQQAANEAVETLRRNLNCDNPQAENRAAQLILDNVLGNSDAEKGGNREIVISFNFNNSVRIQ